MSRDLVIMIDDGGRPSYKVSIASRNLAYTFMASCFRPTLGASAVLLSTNQNFSGRSVASYELIRSGRPRSFRKFLFLSVEDSASEGTPYMVATTVPWNFMLATA